MEGTLIIIAQLPILYPELTKDDKGMKGIPPFSLSIGSTLAKEFKTGCSLVSSPWDSLYIYRNAKCLLMALSFLLHPTPQIF